jgi:hypothetical protein
MTPLHPRLDRAGVPQTYRYSALWRLTAVIWTLIVCGLLSSVLRAETYAIPSKVLMMAMLAGCSLGGIQVITYRIILDERGISSRTLWGRPIFRSYSDIVKVSLTPNENVQLFFRPWPLIGQVARIREFALNEFGMSHAILSIPKSVVKPSILLETIVEIGGRPLQMSQHSK